MALISFLLKKAFLPLFCGGRTQNDGSQTQSFHLSTSKAAFFGSPTEAQPQISQVLHGLHPKLWIQVSAYIPSDFEYLQRLTCIHVPGLTDGSLCGFVFWGCLWIWFFVFVPCNFGLSFHMIC